MNRIRRALAVGTIAMLFGPGLATWVAAAPGDDPTSSTTSTTTTEPAATTTEPPATSTTISPSTSTTSTTPTDAPTTTGPTPPTADTTTTAASSTTLAPSGDEPVAADTTTTTEPPFVILLTPDPTNTIAIDKTNTADGEPARRRHHGAAGRLLHVQLPRLVLEHQLRLRGPHGHRHLPGRRHRRRDDVQRTDCLVRRVAGLRDVTYDSAPGRSPSSTPSLSPTQPGSRGKIAGTSDNFTVRVTLPADTPLDDGDVIPNEATISADNVAAPATDPSNVIVDVPRIVGVQTTKGFTDPSAIAGDPNATTTMQLGSINQSSNSAAVTNHDDRGLDRRDVRVPRRHRGQGHAVPGRRHPGPAVRLPAGQRAVR